MFDDGLSLCHIKKSDSLFQKNMSIHYSEPKGFVGRQIPFAIIYNGLCYGHISGGSATLHLPGRSDFFKNVHINNIVNNTFFHIEKIDNSYPTRNFVQKVLKEYQRIIPLFWKYLYGDEVVGFETLVEPPRTGECYIRDKWTYVGTTKGYTCKRTSEKIAGQSTDSWGGRRIWDYENLRPKLVFCKWNINGSNTNNCG